MKKIPCKLVMNGALGNVSPVHQCDSISQAVKKAKNSPYFYYYIFVNGKRVKQGFCD